MTLIHQLRSSLACTALILASTLASTGCGNAEATTQAERPPEPLPEKNAVSLSGHRVEVAVVRPSARALELTVPGEVEGFRDASLASPLGGYVERVFVEEGARVTAGQALAYVDRATHGVRHGRARVELASAKRELARTKALGDAIPHAEIDAAEDRVKLADAAIAELALNSSRAVLKAPFAGVIVEVDMEVGEVAAPGAPLLRLVQLSPIKVSVALSDRDMSLAKVGSKARVQLDARAGVFEGRIASISKAAQMKTRSFRAIVEVPNDTETLLPGMIANVTLDAKEQAADALASKGPTDKDGNAKAPPKDQLIISQDWLVTKRDGVGVFVEEGGKAVWRPVQLGDILRKQVVVTSGLTTGDSLIINGHRDLVDGDKVLVHRRGECCTAGRATFSN